MSDFLDQFTSKNYKKEDIGAPVTSSEAGNPTEAAVGNVRGAGNPKEAEGLPSPVSNEESPVSTQKPPVSTQESPVSTQESPVSTQGSPISIQESPVVPKELSPSASESEGYPEAEVAWADPSTPRTAPPIETILSKQSSPQKFSGVKATEHDIVIDTTFNRNKTIRIISVCATAVLLCVGVFFAYLYLSKVPMLDFQGKNISEARTWALKNQIELDEQFEYSDTVESDIILTQSIKPGDKISKKTAITLFISEGPDPDEKIEVPDFSALTVPEIQEWIDENNLLNTQFQEENSSTIEKGEFIREEYRDVSVDKDHFTRVDYLTIYVSIGLEGMTESIRVPDFVNMTKTAADSWAQNNNITLLYSLKLSETVAADIIMSQENLPGTTVPSGSTIRLAVSSGAGILVPDYYKILKEDAPAAQAALTLTIKSQYSFSVPYGKLISQSVPSGEHVFAAQNQVTLVYSEGKPYIDNLVGTSEKEIPAYFYAFKQKGLAIPYTITYVDSSVEKGKVVTASRFNEFLSSIETIAIGISKGNLPIPTPTPSP